MNQFFSVKVAFYFGLRMGSGAILTIKFCAALVSAKQIEQLPILMSTKIVYYICIMEHDGGNAETKRRQTIRYYLDAADADFPH